MPPDRKMPDDPADWVVCNDPSCCSEEKVRIHREAVARRAENARAASGTEPERAHDFPAGLVDLAVMLSDLEGFIERRAADLARPLMEDAERAITSAGRRVADLQAESGRLTRSLERQLAGTKAELAAVTANCVRLLAELRRKLDELAVARRERDAAKAESRHNAEIAASALDRLRAEAPAE